jgi:Carboxypeptidase regulatory-like domain/TonB-dependent Receptor Plug Domain
VSAATFPQLSPLLRSWGFVHSCRLLRARRWLGQRLSGTVTDPSGAAIPGAKVLIKNQSTAEVTSVTSDSAGFYSAPNLVPAAYQVSISASGFRTVVTNVTLTVGAQQTLNVPMQVGQATQQVEVTGAAAAVQLATSSLSAEVNSTTVRELPLNGRSWTDLATLQPGVALIETHPGVDVNRGFGSQLTISGGRPQQNNYRIDGISVNDYSNGGPGSVLGGNLGVDAIQEFSVLTSNYSAEYGKTSGGVVNAITKSGTNQFHGDAYWFLRDEDFDARNFFDKNIAPFHRNQYGASAGGPIQKDKTFIFGDYERIQQALGVSNFSTVLSTAARAGDLASGPVTVNPLIPKYLAMEPLPNGTTSNPDIGTFSFAGNQETTENFFTTRLDHRFSEKDSIFGTYLFDNAPQTTPDPLDNTIIASHSRRQIAALEETRVISPAVVNSFRMGYNRDSTFANQYISAINPAAADPSLGFAPGLDATQAFVAGLAQIGPGLRPPTFSYAWNAFQVYDDAFLTRGAHSLKFGGGYEADQMNAFTWTGGFVGQFNFGSISKFLQNEPSRVQGVVPGFISPRGMRVKIFGAYVEDDWHARPNLTLNLGLRYEMATTITEVQGKLTNDYNLTDGNPHLGDPYFNNPTHLNFEPRVGFSWDPFHNGKTAVRGGFGVFDVLPLLYETVTLDGRGAPFYQVGSTSHLPHGSFPGGALPFLTGRKLEHAFVEHDPSRNYVMQWNFNIQRELTPSLTAQVGYVASRGVHQAFRSDDANMVLPPTLTSAGYVWPNPIGSGTVLNPAQGAIRFLGWGGNSAFDSFQAGIVKRMSHGVQIQGSFTWGKSIDNNSGVIAGDTLNNAVSALHWYNLALSRGLSDFNIPLTLVINGTWNVPGLKSGPAALNWIASGWELGGIMTARDGYPFTPVFGNTGDPLGMKNSDPYDFPNVLTGSGCSSLINPGNPTNYVKTQCFALPTAPNMAFWQANCDTTSGIFGPNLTPEPFPYCFNLRGNAGRNIIPAPGLVNLDFSVFKNNPVRRISENFNIQFRAEVFNIFNRANFSFPEPEGTGVGDAIFDAAGAPTGTAGLITATTTAAREIQFALKVIW